MDTSELQQHGIEGFLNNRVFHCYIDESGDEGYQLASGSSPWFFLAALIMQDEQEPAVRHAIDEIEDKLWRSKGQIAPKVLHWKDLRYEQKVVVCQVLRQKPYLQVTVGIRKGEIRDGALIKQSGFLYRYTTRVEVKKKQAPGPRIPPVPHRLPPFRRPRGFPRISAICYPTRFRTKKQCFCGDSLPLCLSMQKGPTVIA